MSVALASEALTLTSLLLEDLNSETSKMPEKNEEIANLDLYQTFKASQRVALILNSVPLIPLLFNVAFVSFKKGLVSSDGKSSDAKKEELEAEIEADEDDDSEPILGNILIFIILSLIYANKPLIFVNKQLMICNNQLILNKYLWLVNNELPTK